MSRRTTYGRHVTCPAPPCARGINFRGASGLAGNTVARIPVPASVAALAIRAPAFTADQARTARNAATGLGSKRCRTLKHAQGECQLVFSPPESSRPVEYPQPPIAPRNRLWETDSVKPPILRVTKWLTVTPAIAVCTQCNREFRVPLSALARTKDAQDYLQQQFDQHKCEPQLPGST